MNSSGWIAIAAILVPTLLIFALGWARLSSRLAVMEALLRDAISRPTRWCVEQQKECGRIYEHAEITGVGHAGHA
jgi:hypothetical protein